MADSLRLVDVERLLTQIVEAYLDCLATQSPASRWAVDAVLDLKYERRWEDLWDIVVAITRREEEIPPEVLAVVAAGPLEDLICGVGPQFIERIEHEARFNRRFGYVLTGVWLSSASPEIRERIVKFCRAFRGPMDGEYRF